MTTARCCLLLASLVALECGRYPDAGQGGSDSSYDSGIIAAQTDVHRARHEVDDCGVPILDIPNIGRQRHPAWIALYALAYAGVDVYDESMSDVESSGKFLACLDWLEKSLRETPGGLWVWDYLFDSTYNDVTIRAPWSSGFAQAVGVQAFLAGWELTGTSRYLELARRAAKAIVTPISQGGLLFAEGDFVWFEEIPEPPGNPTHILNGHLRATLALFDLADATCDPETGDWARRGIESLLRRLPLFDTGHWLRYDLNPRKSELLFRFANPYGGELPSLAVDRIALRDPLTGEEIAVDVGCNGDDFGPARIAGIHWGPRERLLGRDVRRLVPADSEMSTEEMGPPHSYFYLSLPGEWTTNLRDRPLEMVVDYRDETRANTTVQRRAISPGPSFRDLRESDLLLTGEDQWRRWLLPVRTQDLGYWVGLEYAEKHAQYLTALAKRDDRLQPWARRADGYERLAKPFVGLDEQQVSPVAARLPTNTPPLQSYKLDDGGVLMQAFSAESADPSTERFVYTPFLTARQALQGEDLPEYPRGELDPSLSCRKPALEWLRDPSNRFSVDEAAIFTYPFRNVYNNVISDPPWPSAFGQAYVLKAFLSAKQDDLASNLDEDIASVANAYTIPVEQGGIVASNRRGQMFFEEVPNLTHILCGHLTSIPPLHDAAIELGDPKLARAVSGGVNTLLDVLHLYDAGYWLRYDLNPRPDLLLQIDWIEGSASPLIDEVILEEPELGRFVRLDVGSAGDFDGASRISGTDWETTSTVDGRSVRAVARGSTRRSQPPPGGAIQSTFLILQCPDGNQDDWFDVAGFRLLLRYRDEAPGTFQIGIRRIDDGDQLSFVPLRGPALRTLGDGRWKWYDIRVRPQDLGWYKGESYQRYEVGLLQELGNRFRHWRLSQAAHKQRHALEMRALGKDFVVRDPGHPQEPRPTIDLRVLESSPTYPQHGFENCLDGDVLDDYAAVLSDGDAFVKLLVTPPTSLEALEFQWESPRNRAGRVEVRLLDESGRSGRVIGTSEGSISATCRIPLSSESPIAGLEIRFGDLRGRPNLLLRRIHAERDRGGDGNSDPDSVFLDAWHPRNPLRNLRLPITNRVKSLADRLAAGAKSEHEVVHRFLTHLVQWQIGLLDSGSPDEAIENGMGSCGDLTNLLLAMAATQGIQGRHVNLHNYPPGSGHTVAELMLGKRWELYDPTFGAWYESRHDSPPRALSFVELREASQQNPESVRTRTLTWRPSIVAFTGVEIFRSANPAGPMVPDFPMAFPLRLSIDGESVIDRSDFVLNSPRYQGADSLGVAQANQHQEWTLSGLNPGAEYEFVLTPDHLGGDVDSSDLSFELTADISGADLLVASGHRFEFSAGTPEPWTIRFRPYRPSARLTLSHPYRGPLHRYLAPSRYLLRPAAVGESGIRPRLSELRP